MQSQSYLDRKASKARALVGKRVELPVHYDAWACGARFGTVTRVGGGAQSQFVYVKMDHPQLRRSVKLWAMDFEHAKVIG